jgi:hypothetical protein
MSIKEGLIKEYLMRVDFKNDDWSMHTITSDMQKFLGETPAFDVFYKKDVMVNEVSGRSQEIKKVSKVSVIFTDDNNKIRKIEFLIS